MVAGEEQQAERDLGDEERLREREELRRDPARVAPAPIGPERAEPGERGDGDDRERERVVGR